jgi:hypothetical protein
MRLTRLLSSFIIKSKNHCINCVHVKPFKHPNLDYDEIYEKYPPSPKCSIFGEQDVVTGEITYEYAFACRFDNSKCGKEGRYFSNAKIKNK